MKRIKNIFYSFPIQNHRFFTDVLKQRSHGIPRRFVVHLSFLILPVLSQGQGWHTEANAFPLSGLENIYVAQQENIAPVLFVASNTIIAKSATTIFFVNGSIQMDGFLVAQTDVMEHATQLRKKKQIKINPTTEVVAAEVKQSDKPSAVLYFPWNKNPIQQELFCVSFAMVSAPSIPVLKQKDHKPFHLQLLASNLLRRVYKASCYAVFVTSYATMAYGRHVTLFSSRPPPKSRIA